jgi:ribonuclease HII
MPETSGLTHELELWQSGKKIIGGIDEAGRGALAGPVFAACVILPDDIEIQTTLRGARDSKQMTALQRERLAARVKEVARDWGIGSASAHEIDELGILPATRLAVTRAIESLSLTPNFFLFDHLPWKNCPYPRRALVRGESQSLSIAAASILAKTERDEHMRQLDERYPGYGFARHKGYGTAQHRAAIQSLGTSVEHRGTFHVKI